MDAGDERPGTGKLKSDRFVSLYRDTLNRAERAEADLASANSTIGDLRREITRLRRLIAVPAALVRRFRRLIAPKQAKPATPVSSSAARTSAEPPVEPEWRAVLKSRFDAWLVDAAASDGADVVVIFSTAPAYSEPPELRPLYLAEAFLERNSPVFLAFHRPQQTDPLPENPDPLLMQCPIDALPVLLDTLLTARFDGKQRSFLVTSPHELVVRNLTLAAQHGWVTVYDAYDNWEEAARLRTGGPYSRGLERYVAMNADIVTAVTEPLATKVAAICGRRDTFVVANGIDPAFPATPVRQPTTDQPTIGCLSYQADDRLDWLLIRNAARRFPRYTFEFVGRSKPTMRQPENVRLLGSLGRPELAERSATWTVAIAPFTNGALADASDPIEVYEMLRLGLPIVANYLPACREFPNVYVTESHTEFMDRLRNLMATPPHVEPVADWLADQTWQHRADRFTQLASDVRTSGRTGLSSLLGALR